MGLEKLKDKERAIQNNNNIDKKIEIPTYDSSGKSMTKMPVNKKTKKKMWLILVIVVCMLGFIYIPSFFMTPKIEEKDNKRIVEPNSNIISLRQTVLKSSSSLDFDNDGLTNEQEEKYNSDPYSWDTDGDGICDGEEVEKDLDPTKSEDKLTELANSEYKTSSIKINNVVLWADNDYYKTHCGVVKNVAGGYVFDNFKGWATFAEGKYAYKYSNGEHKLLQKNEEANAWYIDEENTVVYLTDTPKDTNNKFTFFGNSLYASDNFFFNLCSTILPDYGFISCKNVYTEDTFIDTDYDTTVDLEEIKYDEYNYERLKKNSNRLTDLTTVYNTINEGRPLLVSIYEEDEGETILLVYGYTKEGNLLLCNPTTEDEDILYIYPHSRRAINKEGQVIQYEYFEYDGCGFDSTNQKTTISFFSNIDVVEN